MLVLAYPPSYSLLSVILFLLLVLDISVSTVCAYLPTSSTSSRHMMTSTSLRAQNINLSKESPDKCHSHGNGVSVAFLGNSILYFNDTPRFLVNLSNTDSDVIKIEHQNSCLRGGTTLTELYILGNGMIRHGFATENALMENGEYDVGSPTVQELLQSKEKKWDFVVMNEHTQAPARLSTREAFKATLLHQYAPLIFANNNKATVIFVETAAYRLPGLNNSEDLGTTQQFQQKVREGIHSYISTLHDDTATKLSAKMAPVGTAYLHVHNINHDLWQKLFDPWDNFHPSPTVTFLQGCVIYCTMFGSPPLLPRTNEEIAALWKDARMMHPTKKGKDGVALPSVGEVECLWNIAWDICQRENSKL